MLGKCNVRQCFKQRWLVNEPCRPMKRSSWRTDLLSRSAGIETESKIDCAMNCCVIRAGRSYQRKKFTSRNCTIPMNRCAVLIGACCRRVHCEVKARCDRKFEITALSSQNNPLYVKTRNGIGEWNAEPIVLRPQEWAATHKSIICSHLRVRLAIAVADYGDQIWLDKSGRSEYQYGRWQLLVQWFVRYIVLAEISLPTNSPIRLNNAASPSVSRKRRSTRLRTTMLG